MSGEEAEDGEPRSAAGMEGRWSDKKRIKLL